MFRAVVLMLILLVFVLLTTALLSKVGPTSGIAILKTSAVRHAFPVRCMRKGSEWTAFEIAPKPYTPFTSPVLLGICTVVWGSLSVLQTDSGRAG